MGSYKITIKPSAVRELEQIPQKILRQVTRRIQFLSESPRPQGSQKLSNKQLYRIRQGDYRIVYSIDDAAKVVDIVKIGHRREVYR